MKKIIFAFAIFLLFSQMAFSYDLSEIEKAFVKDGKITAYVVVADKGSPSDVLAQLNIVEYLSKNSEDSGMGIAKLASDVDNIYEKNIITIGNPCVNNVTSQIMDYKGGCIFETGLVKFYSKDGKTQLVIYGVSDSSTRAAAASITRREFEGEEKIINPTSTEEAQIKYQKEAEKQKLVEELKKRQESSGQEQPVEDKQTEETQPELAGEPKEDITAKPQSFLSRIINFLKRLFS